MIKEPAWDEEHIGPGCDDDLYPESEPHGPCDSTGQCPFHAQGGEAEEDCGDDEPLDELLRASLKAGK